METNTAPLPRGTPNERSPAKSWYLSDGNVEMKLTFSDFPSALMAVISEMQLMSAVPTQAGRTARYIACTVKSQPGSLPVLQIAIFVSVPEGVPSLVVKLNHEELSVLEKLVSFAWNPKVFGDVIAGL